MKKSVLFATITITMTTGIASAADFGRIQDPKNPNNASAAITRCGNAALPAQKCSEMRNDGVKSGCITATEAQKLEEWGLAPVCLDKFFSGLEQYRGWCACGCFHPDTQIDIINSSWDSVSISDIVQSPDKYLVKSMMDGATFDGAFPTTAARIAYTTQGAESRPLVMIQTEDGRALRVTEQHAIMLASGEMVQARTIQPGMMLVDRSGGMVSVAAVGAEYFRGNVLNLRLAVNNPMEHVLFAEGLAVGDQAWQSSLEDQQNRVLVRR